MSVVISSALFHRRAALLLSNWNNKTEELAPIEDVDNLLIVAGNSDEDNPYRKGSALQTYLLGYEFPSTLMLLTKDKFYIVVSVSKAKLLEPILTPPAGVEAAVSVEILTRTKDEAENKALFQKILEVIGANKVGTLPKDKMQGKFVNEWAAMTGAAAIKLDEVDAAPGVACLLAVKDEQELKNEDHAAKMTGHLMSHFSDVMSTYIADNKRVSHEQLGEQIESKLEDVKYWKKIELGDEFETGFGDWCYSPIIQSGGNYDLKSSAQTDDKLLKSGVIICSLGIRYKSYCSNLARTFMIDPDMPQEENYLYVVALQKYVLSELKDGAVCKDVYNLTLEKIRADRPDLEACFVKTLGFGMGLEFKDTSYTIGPKGTRTLKSNMIFSLTLGFSKIPNSKPKGEPYAISLIDTIKITPTGAVVMSEGMKSKDDVHFFTPAEDKKPSKGEKGKNGKASPRKALGNSVVKTKLRGETREIDHSAVIERKAHQKELSAKRHADGLEKYAADGGNGKHKEKQWRRFESYARESQLPDSVATQQIKVDARKFSIILPINGFAVPFHINTLKSIIKQDEGEYTVLRFMFVTPGAVSGKKEDTPFEDANATFIRGITYRSLDSFRFVETYKEITELKKAATKRDNERKELADVVEQDRLIEIKGKRTVKLTDVQVRPSFDGKRQSGDVEIQQNGLRYQSTMKSEQKIDILFSNIKHLIFQPCDSELIVVLHIHLKNPIVIGKKKAKDIQFFREAADASFDETGNKKRRRNFADEDELESEQEERKRRADLNKYFKAFADKIAEASNSRVEVDIPFRELAFSGVPFRSNVLLQPTTDTLVFLTEPPFLVLTLAEIEIAHLERVQYGLKNFDLVFVFSDFSRSPIHINTIPTGQLDNVKEWLDSVDIPYSEGPVNLAWAAIMKTVNEDTLGFFTEGGWSFLGEGEAEDGSDNESSDGSEFEASEGASGNYSESDSASDFSDGSASGGSSDSDGGEQDESGDDWDAQEEKEMAKEKDRAANSDSDDDKKKSKSKSKAGKR